LQFFDDLPAISLSAETAIRFADMLNSQFATTKPVEE
jgi:hypothetical protein